MAHCLTAPGGVAARPDPVARIRRSWCGLLARVDDAVARQRQRHRLRELDDRLLADIGISREQALDEAAKPFWR